MTLPCFKLQPPRSSLLLVAAADSFELTNKPAARRQRLNRLPLQPAQQPAALITRDVTPLRFQPYTP